MRLSTILLIILLLFIVRLANAQITLSDLHSAGDVNKLNTGTLSYLGYPLIDTIKSDFIVVKEGKVIPMSGYEVIKRSGPMRYPETTVEWFYLDEKKRPLSKSINVWMSKPVKK